MRVAIVGTAANSLIRFRGSIIRAMVNRGYEVHAYACCISESDAKKIEALGAKPMSLSIDRSSVNPFKDIWTFMELFRHFRKKNYDLFFGYTAKPVIFGTVAAFFAGIDKKVGMLEGLGYCFTEIPEGSGPKKSFLKWVQTTLFKCSIPLLDKILFLNEDDSSELSEVCRIKFNDPIIFGPIGLDLGEFPFVEQPEGPFSFLFVGRLLKEKGIREFTQAAQRIYGVAPEVKFIVVGDIDPSNPSSLTKKDIEQIKKFSNIEFVGWTENVQPYIKQSNVFVLPSYREGYSRSVQEAMAMGRAIITTDAPGCREAVNGGQNGVLVKKADVDSLYEAMLFFVENRNMAEVMGLNSFDQAQLEFDEEEISKKFIDLIKF